MMRSSGSPSKYKVRRVISDGGKKLVHFVDIERVLVLGEAEVTHLGRYRSHVSDIADHVNVIRSQIAGLLGVGDSAF